MGILLALARDNGHEHPNLEMVLDHYGGLLVQLGDTKTQAVEKIRAIAAQYGVST